MNACRPIFLLLLLACAQASAQGDDLDRLLQERGLTDAPPAQTVRPAVDTGAAGAPADRMSDLVVAAMGAIVVPYRMGGNSYDSGFDCSGFVRAVYGQSLGLTLPRQAAQQAAATHVIDREQLRPGDLVFFNTLRRSYSHVGIYVGDHKFIHSPRPGAAVRIEDMRVNYWNRRFDGARRVTGDVPVRAPVQIAADPALLLQNY
jgi:cell wall-associated NlpC family hydrolase